MAQRLWDEGLCIDSGGGSVPLRTLLLSAGCLDAHKLTATPGLARLGDAGHRGRDGGGTGGRNESGSLSDPRITGKIF